MGRPPAHLLAAAAMAWIAAPATGAPHDLALHLGSVAGPGWQARGVQLELTLDEGGRPASASLRARHLHLTTPEFSAEEVRLRCPRLEHGEAGYGCPGGWFAAQLPELGPQQGSLDLSYDPTRRTVTFRLGDIAVGAGTAAAEGRWSPGQWRLHLHAEALPAARLAAIAGERWPEGWSAAGTLGLDALLEGAAGGLERASADLEWQGGGFSDAAGLRAGEALDGRLRVQARRDQGAWSLYLDGEAGVGQIYLDPVFLDLTTHPLRLSALVGLGDGVLQVQQLELTQQGVLSATADARLAWPSLAPESAWVRHLQATLPAAYELYGAPWLTPRAGRLDVAGALTGELRLARGRLAQLTLGVDSVSLATADGRHALEALEGHLHWRDTAAGTPLASRLAWQSGRLYGMPLGAAHLSAVLQGPGFRLTEPARLPVLDGALLLRQLSAVGLDGPQRRLSLDAELEPVGLQSFTRALGWPEFAGRLSGRLPSLSYRDNAVSIGGELTVEAFDGRIGVRDFGLRDPLGAYPELTADVRLRDLNLELLTRTFSFGRITGRLEGDIEGLRLVGWEPAAFRAWFATPEDDRSRHRISQRAVENLASLGGGGAGAALSRGLLGLFDEFRYDRIGLGCVLRENVCLMRGLGPAQNGYYIVRGAGLPRVNVIGHSRVVNWSTLVSQLRTVTAGGGPVIE